MSIGYNGSIVRNDLILLVDSANIKCYPGSGTTVVDQARGISGTMGSSVSYNATNKSFVFTDNTINNLIQFNSGTADYEFPTQTVSIWFKTTTVKQNMDFVTGTASTNTTYRWRHQTSNTQGGAKGIELDWIHTGGWGHFSNSVINYDDGKWHNFVSTFTGSLGQLYWDGELIAYTSSGATDWTTGANINRINIGGDQAELGSNFIGEMSQIAFYRRVLPASEIRNNFNAVRGRYGV